MTDVELKEKLIEKFGNTNDGELLNQISRLIALEAQIEDVYKLSPDELKAVKEGIDQIESGSFVSNEEANKIFNKCLEK